MKKVFLFVTLAAAVAVTGVLAYLVWKNSTQTAQMFFDSGKKYYDQNKYLEASIQFLNAIRKDPGHRDSLYFLARTSTTQGNFPAAVAQLKTLLEYYPDDVAANLELGHIYLA